MRQLVAIALILVLGACTKAPEKRVLIYTKNGVGYVHDNIPAATKALQELCDEQGIGYEVSDDPAIFTEEKLKQFDALIFNNTNNDVFDNDAQRLVFRRYIQAGGGFVGIHSACGSERNWPWFWSMLGGKFIRHCPYQPITVRVIDTTDISTRHLGQTWVWEDEGYYLKDLNPDIHVLLAHDMTSINDKGKEEYPADVFGDLFPSTWHHEFEGGREWYTAYGHNKDHYSDPDFRKMLIGGILWATEKGKPDFSKATAQ
ncbi:MAG: ThuA domain-containing protein, partial [Bacteroidales bacterium]|nr:ThuA domain-containing protein [Bacteroidales bacterium]